jgi:hypothetical protein
MRSPLSFGPHVLGGCTAALAVGLVRRMEVDVQLFAVAMVAAMTINPCVQASVS